MGAVVVDLPPGPFIGLADDHNQRWIIDMGIPGPDGGRGGKYLLLPPEYRGSLPPGYFIARSPTYKVLLALRAIPNDGGVRDAFDALRQVKVYPLSKPESVLPFVDVTNRTIDNTPLRWEDNLEYWRRLHAVIDSEPTPDEYRPMYGELAALGVEKGRRFEPDAKMRDILESAARIGRDQMLVEGFASQRADRRVWSDRGWEWVGLTPDDANFETKDFIDLQARERWFIQAIVASPAMFRRRAGSGSVYFLAARDGSGTYLDGGRQYKLRVPQPVPAKMFWSLTAYDSGTRSQVQTPQNRAVLSSLADDLERNVDGSIDVYFGPRAPAGKEKQWIRTAPGTGFFLYFRIYGPEPAALDGSWRLGDLLELGVPARKTVETTAWADTLRSISTPELVHTQCRPAALHRRRPERRDRGQRLRSARSHARDRSVLELVPGGFAVCDPQGLPRRGHRTTTRCCCSRS